MNVHKTYLEFYSTFWGLLIQKNGFIKCQYDTMSVTSSSLEATEHWYYHQALTKHAI